MMPRLCIASRLPPSAAWGETDIQGTPREWHAFGLCQKKKKKEKKKKKREREGRDGAGRSRDPHQACELLTTYDGEALQRREGRLTRAGYLEVQVVGTLFAEHHAVAARMTNLCTQGSSRPFSRTCLLKERKPDSSA